MNSYKNKDWHGFSTFYGTHFAYDVTMGGRATQEIILTSESTSKLQSMGVDVKTAVQAKFAKLHGDASFEFSKHEKEV